MREASRCKGREAPSRARARECQALIPVERCEGSKLARELWRERKSKKERDNKWELQQSQCVTGPSFIQTVTKRIKNKVTVTGARHLQCAVAGTVSVVIHGRLGGGAFTPNNLPLKGESAPVRSEKKKKIVQHVHMYNTINLLRKAKRSVVRLFVSRSAGFSSVEILTRSTDLSSTTPRMK